MDLAEIINMDTYAGPSLNKPLRVKSSDNQIVDLVYRGDFSDRNPQYKYIFDLNDPSGSNLNRLYPDYPTEIKEHNHIQYSCKELATQRYGTYPTYSWYGIQAIELRNERWGVWINKPQISAPDLTIVSRGQPPLGKFMEPSIFFIKKVR